MSLRVSGKIVLYFSKHNFCLRVLLMIMWFFFHLVLPRKSNTFFVKVVTLHAQEFTELLSSLWAVYHTIRESLLNQSFRLIRFMILLPLQITKL